MGGRCPQAQRKPSAAVQKAPPTDRQGGRWRNRGGSIPTPRWPRHLRKWRDCRRPSTRWEISEPRSRCLQEIFEEGSGSCARTSCCEVGEGVQGVHRSVHEANHEVESGVGCGDSVASREPCTSVEVGGAAGSNRRHTGRHGTRCKGCEFAADGEAVASGARRSSQELRRSRAPQDTTHWALNVTSTAGFPTGVAHSVT